MDHVPFCCASGAGDRHSLNDANYVPHQSSFVMSKDWVDGITGIDQLDSFHLSVGMGRNCFGGKKVIPEGRSGRSESRLVRPSY
jgi:hypothetical protein